MIPEPTTALMTTVDDTGRRLMVDRSKQMIEDGGNYILKLANEMYWFSSAPARFHAAHGAEVIGRITWVATPA